MALVSTKRIRELKVAMIAGALVAGMAFGGTAFAQEGSPAATTGQTTQQDNDFPWGLLGLLGLGGLAGLRRRDEPRRVDTSRTSSSRH